MEREGEGKVRRSLWRGGEKKWKRLDGKNHAAAKNHKKQALLKGAPNVFQPAAPFNDDTCGPEKFTCFRHVTCFVVGSRSRR